MAKRDSEEDFKAIEEAVQQHPDGMTAQQIHDALKSAPPRRTLQSRLKALVDSGRLVRDSSGRWARYRMVVVTKLAMKARAGLPRATFHLEALPLLSEVGVEIREQIRRPLLARHPVGYERGFLETYRPNHTFYLSQAERDRLRELGTPNHSEQAAGTYARKILDRLLIDLSWNSSRLEGNTYSLLETKRLIEWGRAAEGKERIETQMILNHKDAIEFLVDGAEEIGFNRHTILNLHALLANNLLGDPDAAGRLRHGPVGIGGSVFHPLEVPQLIEECFEQILDTASAIADPFEQSFFVLVQLPYLQPFDDVNKRVSRLAANIPLLKWNLSPLSFIDVPQDIYTEGLLGVYELNRTQLLRDVFLLACERSAARYAAVRQSLGEPDPFRMQHRENLREVVGAVVRGAMDQDQANSHINAWTSERIDQQERGRFREIVERELMGLHEGNFARYSIRPSEFAAWQAVWNKG